MEKVELKPCRDCGSHCRVEHFDPVGPIINGATLWVCANHRRFGGNCPNDQAYLYADAWNERQSAAARPREAALEAALAAIRRYPNIETYIGTDLCDMADAALQTKGEEESGHER